MLSFSNVSAIWLIANSRFHCSSSRIPNGDAVIRFNHCEGTSFPQRNTDILFLRGADNAKHFYFGLNPRIACRNVSPHISNVLLVGSKKLQPVSLLDLKYHTTKLLGTELQMPRTLKQCNDWIGISEERQKLGVSCSIGFYAMFLLRAVTNKPIILSGFSFDGSR